jgi:thioredoxin 1
MIKYITELNPLNFSEFVSKGLILVDIKAIWCGPCKVIGPIVDEISNTYNGRLSVGKLDVDDVVSTTDESGEEVILSNKDIISELGIRNIPTILLYKDGQLVKDENGLVDKLVGSVTKEKLVNLNDKETLIDECLEIFEKFVVNA